MPSVTRPSAVRATEITGHRARVPVPLLMSRRHTPLAVAAYALIDLFTPRRGHGQPYAAHRDTIAARLGAPVRTLADAFRAMSNSHTGPGLGETHPAYLVTRRRGCQLTAYRSVTPVVPYVQVPAWTLGDASGPLVDWTAWRLYVALLCKRLRDGTCRLSAGELAGLIGVRRQRVATLLRCLVAAGLAVVVAAAGRAPTIVPLVTETTAAERAALSADAVAAWSPTHPAPGPPPADQPGPQPADAIAETHLPSHIDLDTAVPDPTAGLTGRALYRAVRAALAARHGQHRPPRRKSA